MTPSPAPRSSRPPLLLLVSTGLLGCALGWGLHGWSGLGAKPPEAAKATPAAARPAPAPLPDEALVAPAKGPLPHEILEHMLAADSTDMVDLMESIGVMTRMTDAEVKAAWASLAGRTPSDTMGGSAAVLYLWSRMTRLDAGVAMPRGWGAENFVATIDLVKVRRDLPGLLARLNAGENLSEAERRAVFTDLVQTDPLGAAILWVKNTKPWDYRGDARWFGEALANPETRDALMAELRAWQKDGDLGGATLALAWNWIARDPAAVEQWLKQPEQADVRATVMQQVANARVLSNPLDAWTWSEGLPADERIRALGMSAGQLANQNPEAGARLVAGLQNPAERQEAIRQYGKTLAANNLEQWKTWRDTLPEAERVFANESGFDLWVYHEPEQALQWLNTQPEGRTKDQMITTLVDVYAARDPRVAADWIQSIPDPARRKEAAVTALTTIGPGNLDSVRTILDAAKD